jgi:hypothetical protein
MHLHRKRISQKLYQKFPHNSAGLTEHSQAWIDSRNQTTITSEWKHRQPIFLHPTVEAGRIRRKTLRECPSTALPYLRRGELAESVSILYTTSFPFY